MALRANVHAAGPADQLPPRAPGAWRRTAISTPAGNHNSAASVLATATAADADEIIALQKSSKNQVRLATPGPGMSTIG